MLVVQTHARPVRAPHQPWLSSETSAVPPPPTLSSSATSVLSVASPGGLHGAHLCRALRRSRSVRPAAPQAARRAKTREGPAPFSRAKRTVRGPSSTSTARPQQLGAGCSASGTSSRPRHRLKRCRVSWQCRTGSTPGSAACTPAPGSLRACPPASCRWSSPHTPRVPGSTSCCTRPHPCR